MLRTIKKTKPDHEQIALAGPGIPNNGNCPIGHVPTQHVQETTP